MNKIDEIVNKNNEKFRQLNNYIVQGSKSITTNDGHQHRVPVNLQIFTTETGKIKLLREV